MSRSWAPRSGAGDLASGTRFLRTPGRIRPTDKRTAEGGARNLARVRVFCVSLEEKGQPIYASRKAVRGILVTPTGCGVWLRIVQAYAKNAYAWLISQARLGVRETRCCASGVR